MPLVSGFPGHGSFLLFSSPMAQDIPPQLYLSLLSGRYGDVSHLSEENRDNEVGSRLSDSDHPFRKDPHRLLDVLDALAAICVHNSKGDIFFVSLSMNPNSSSLHVSTNGTVSTALTDHLRKVRSQLKVLKDVLKPGPPTSADIESPDPGKSPERADCELMLQKTIYEYSYKKVQQRFTKRGPVILANYDVIVKNLEAKNLAADTELLDNTHVVLRAIGGALKDTNPQERHLSLLIEAIKALSMAWRECLESTEATVLTRWDDLTRKSGISPRHL